MATESKWEAIAYGDGLVDIWTGNRRVAIIFDTTIARRIINCLQSYDDINPEAVPDLLEIVKKFVSWIGDDCDCKNGQPATCVKCLARAALAKAGRKD